MADDREMRAEMREGFEKAFGDLAELRGSVSELQIAVSALSVDLKVVKEDVAKILEIQANQGARLKSSTAALRLSKSTLDS